MECGEEVCGRAGARARVPGDSGAWRGMAWRGVRWRALFLAWARRGAAPHALPYVLCALAATVYVRVALEGRGVVDTL